MTPEQQMRLEKDLQAARDRQEGKGGTAKKGASKGASDGKK
jgi:hypothetical protein